MSVISIMAAVFIMAALRAALQPDKSKRRRIKLEAKYGSWPLLQTILEGTITAGMSEEEVLDALGKPAGRLHRVHKAKTTDTLRYEGGRSALRVKLEDGRVVGWSRSE